MKISNAGILATFVMAAASFAPVAKADSIVPFQISGGIVTNPQWSVFYGSPPQSVLVNPAFDNPLNVEVDTNELGNAAGTATVTSVSPGVADLGFLGGVTPVAVLLDYDMFLPTADDIFNVDVSAVDAQSIGDEYQVIVAVPGGPNTFGVTEVCGGTITAADPSQTCVTHVDTNVAGTRVQFVAFDPDGSPSGDLQFSINPPAAATPEPGTLGLVLFGLVAGTVCVFAVVPRRGDSKLTSQPASDATPT